MTRYMPFGEMCGLGLRHLAAREQEPHLPRMSQVPFVPVAMVALVEMSGCPVPIRACWLAWIAVRTSRQADVIGQLGLLGTRQISWEDGADLVDEVAHTGDERFPTVVVTPAIMGWTLVIGPWCGLLYLQNIAPVTGLCRELSTRFGQAQAYFHSEQNDGEAWLAAENGIIRRRWIGGHPELALGEPFGAERRLLDSYGITGKPEDLDPDADKLNEWDAGWGDCYATTIAAELSIDPTTIGEDVQVAGSMLVADAPSFATLDPDTGLPL